MYAWLWTMSIIAYALQLEILRGPVWDRVTLHDRAVCAGLVHGFNSVTHASRIIHVMIRFSPQRHRGFDHHSHIVDGRNGHRKYVLALGRQRCPWVKVPKPCGTSRMLQCLDRVDLWAHEGQIPVGRVSHCVGVGWKGVWPYPPGCRGLYTRLSLTSSWMGSLSTSRVNYLICHWRGG